MHRELHFWLLNASNQLTSLSRNKKVIEVVSSQRWKGKERYCLYKEAREKQKEKKVVQNSISCLGILLLRVFLVGRCFQILCLSKILMRTAKQLTSAGNDLYGYCSISCNTTKISKNFISKHTVMLLNTNRNFSSFSTFKEQNFCFFFHPFKTNPTSNQQLIHEHSAHNYNSCHRNVSPSHS